MDKMTIIDVLPGETNTEAWARAEGHPVSHIIHDQGDEEMVIGIEPPTETVPTVVSEVVRPSESNKKDAAMEKQAHCCRVCGKFIPPTNKRGRPAVWCSPECKSKR